MSTFEGEFYCGTGDVEYLQLLDVSRRMFAPDPEFQNITMLYTPTWNGFVEGPKWGAWWVQNSYGTTYCALPFLQEPFCTFLQNAQDCWFDNLGDGKREYRWNGINHGVVPDGQLCDTATPDRAVYKQGDGRVDIHDWGIEFTAAGLLMQAELLLIDRDEKAVDEYLPKLERCTDFVETRRDPNNNLFLAGPASNLLAPSYAGWKKPDGSYGKAYLSGLSITYIAALDRLIEVEKLADNADKVELYTSRRDLARKGLHLMTTDEGYFIKSLDPDGTQHGVYGAKKHGYFEAVCNHDAICFRVSDDTQARKIYDKIVSIPELRPNDFVITNYPALDDMYEFDGLFQFGTWVNGGHWSTCEARMVMSYYRLGEYEYARKSMKQLLTFARRFQMDNPLKDFGATVWFEQEPINLCYDSFGPPAAMIRGLFEYLYRADGLTLLPHIPQGITRLEQKFPIRFGRKHLYLSTVGTGPISDVFINGKPWKSFDTESIFLSFDETPEEAAILVVLGNTQVSPQVRSFPVRKRDQILPQLSPDEEKTLATSPSAGISPQELKSLGARALRIRKLHDSLLGADMAESTEAAFARLIINSLAVIYARVRMQAESKLDSLPSESQCAADRSYIHAVVNLCDGLEKTINSYHDSAEPYKKRVYQLWSQLYE